MRRHVLLAAAGGLTIVLPLASIDSPASAESTDGITAPARAAEITARVSSGKLPDGSKFKIPAPPSAPFPTAASLGIPTSQAAPPAAESDTAYVPQTSCDPTEKRGVTAFKNLVLARFPGSVDWGSTRNCTDDGTSEHLEGRAWDWHADAADATTFAMASQFLTWITANNGYWARRLGILYIGYNYRIWGAYRISDGWRVLNNSNHHTDHVHFSFTWNGAMKRSSFWTGTTPAQDFGPCRIYVGQPAPLYSGRNTSGCQSPSALPARYQGATLLWRGSTGALVTKAQGKVNAPVTGTFGGATQAAVAAYQRSAHLPVTGAVDAQTWYALKMSPANAPTNPSPSPPVKQPTSTKLRVTLRRGSHGSRVRTLQSALGMRPVTGFFGTKTAHAVRVWKRAHGLKANAKVGPRMWRRLGL